MNEQEQTQLNELLTELIRAQSVVDLAIEHSPGVLTASLEHRNAARTKIFEFVENLGDNEKLSCSEWLDVARA